MTQADRPGVTGIDRLVVRLIRRQAGASGALARVALRLLGVHVPPQVAIGEDLLMPHATAGVVMHPKTRIGDRVTIYHQVTIGRADGYIGAAEDFAGTVIDDDAVLCAGAVILAGNGSPLRIGRGTVVGANAVLTQSTGEWEIWAGNPARKIRDRDQVPKSAQAASSASGSLA